jgi:hypothetical protein
MLFSKDRITARKWVKKFEYKVWNRNAALDVELNEDVFKQLKVIDDLPADE